MDGVLVDSSVWVDHFRNGNQALVDLLDRNLVRVHPFVVGELACGTPPSRKQTLADLNDLPRSQEASLHEVLDFIERERLYGAGCGLVDIVLLTSTLLTPSTALWTLDKQLSALARRFGVGHR